MKKWVFIKGFLKIVSQNCKKILRKIRQCELSPLINTQTHIHTYIGHLVSLHHLPQKFLPWPLASFLFPSIHNPPPRVSWFTLKTRNTTSQLPSLPVNSISRNKEGMLAPPLLPNWAPALLGIKPPQVLYTWLHLPAGKVTWTQGMLGLVVSCWHS